MLSRKIIAEQKKILLKEKARLEKKIKELKEFPDYGQNEDDVAKETADFESNLSVEEQLRFLLKKIDRALCAIKEGSYGICAKCSKPIEGGRLKIIPYAELCITCRKENQQ